MDFIAAQQPQIDKCRYVVRQPIHPSAILKFFYRTKSDWAILHLRMICPTQSGTCVFVWNQASIVAGWPINDIPCRTYLWVDLQEKRQQRRHVQDLWYNTDMKLGLRWLCNSISGSVRGLFRVDVEIYSAGVLSLAWRRRYLTDW